jgi:Tfp pilus assembly protein PilF
MIKCPACGAENPEGTKICVKCGTELPKNAQAASKKEAAQAAANAAKRFGFKDVWRDLLDAVWLIFIILLIAFGFLMEASHWTWPPKFTEMEQAQLLQPSLAPTPIPTVAKKRHGHKAVKVANSVAEPISEQQPIITGNAETFYQKGKKEYDQKNYHASYNYLKQSLEIDPTYANAYFALGYLYAHFNMNDPAVRMYEMALRFDPNHVDSLNNLAFMYKSAGNFDDALSLYQKAVALGTTNADVQFNIGDLYLDKNQPSDALQAFQKASALRPNDPDIYTDLGLTYEKLGMKKEAEDSWGKVLQFSNNAEYIQQAKTHLTFLQTQS